MEFKCTSCGLCCKSIGPAIEAAKQRSSPNVIDQLFIDFPYAPNEDGSCSMQDESGRCSVYDNRPLICNVDKMYEVHYAPYMTKLEHYTTNGKFCNQMIREAELPDKYLIDVEQYKTDTQ